MNASINLENREVQAAFREQFSQHGYTVYPAFFTQREMLVLQRKLSQFVDEESIYMCSEDARYEKKSHQGESLISLENLYLYDLFFEDMLFESKFEKFAKILLQDDVQAQNIQYINRPCPGATAGIAWQDGNQFAISPWEGVTCWLVLEDMTTDQGCIHYVNGSHRLGMRNHSPQASAPEYMGITDFGSQADLENEVKVPAKAGDLLVHHPLTIHRFRSENTQMKGLKAIRMIYYAQRATINEQLIQELQKQYAQQTLSEVS